MMWIKICRTEDGCASLGCRNGGSCLERLGECLCPEGTAGRFCQVVLDARMEDEENMGEFGRTVN